MLTSTYTRRIAILSICLLVVIAVLSVLLYTHGPRVRLVSFELDPHKTSLMSGSAATVLFDRPIQDREYEDLVAISPEVDFTVQTTTQSLVLLFEQNLESSTQYTIQINDQVYDRTGRKMTRPYSHTFETAEPRYAYLERNYGIQDDNTVFTTRDADDHIKIGSLSGESEIVFSHPEIVQFVANSTHVVAVVRSDGENLLYTVDLDGLLTRQIKTLSEGEIHNLSIGARGGVALYSVIPDRDVSDSSYYEQYANSVESLNLETGEAIALQTSDGSLIRAVDIGMDANGQVALLQDVTQVFYAVSPFNDYDPILIGQYTDSFGFNDDSSEIVFRDRDTFARYGVAQASITEQSFGIASYIRSVTNTNSGIVFVASRFDPAGNVSSVELLSDWSDIEPVVLWSGNDASGQRLQEAVISYDVSVFALQFNPENCPSDSFGSYSECTVTSTAIYDSDAQSIVRTVQGHGLVWLP